MALFEESLANYQEVGDSRGVAICLYSLGHQAIARDNARAGELLAEALQIFVTLGDPLAIAETLDVLARVIAECGSAIAAARFLGAAAALRGSRQVPVASDAHYRADYERAAATVRATLDPDGIAAVEHAARDVPLEQLVAEALAAVGSYQRSVASAEVSGSEHADRTS